MIISIRGTAGQFISLDLRAQLGKHVEIDCFHFLVPPIEFRLVRNGVPLQGWQPGSTEMYDFQHPGHVLEWQRHGHCFVNDLDHRDNAMTCGVLSKDLALNPRSRLFNSPFGLAAGRHLSPKSLHHDGLLNVVTVPALQV